MEYKEIKTIMKLKTQELRNLSYLEGEYEPNRPRLFEAIRDLLQELEHPSSELKKSLYTTEFDATKITVPRFLLEGDWEDVSWHNETCPRFVNERLGVAIWVDYDNPKEREMNCIDGPYEENTWKKYTVVQLVQDEDEVSLSDDVLVSFEELEDLENWLKPGPKYLCVWGEGYETSGLPVREERCGLDAFTEQNGYSALDITAIRDLRLGEAYVMCVMYDYGMHTVIRVG